MEYDLVTLFGLSFLALLVLMNLYLSIKFARSPAYKPTYRFLMVALLWLVPVIGIVVAMIINSEIDTVAHDSAN